MKKYIFLLLIFIMILGCSKNNPPRYQGNEANKPPKRTEEMDASEHKIAMPPSEKPKPAGEDIDKKIADIEMIEVDEEGQFDEPESTPKPVFKEPETEALVTPPPEPEAEPEPIPEPMPETRYMEGFRVQVMASSTEEGANKEAAQARAMIPEENVYVTYEAPYWKVRVGDCDIRQDAEYLKERLQNLGYSDAWIVKTQIDVTE
jgi:hypothetical protein